MKKLYEKSEITFAILWIVIYAVGMGTLQNNFGLDSMWHMLGLIVISAAIFLFVKKNGLMEVYGLAGWAKKLTGRPAITVGSVGLNGEFQEAFQGRGAELRSLDNLLDRLERDEFDLVAVGRAVLQDPEWAAKVLGGRLDELAPYDAATLKTLS